MKDEKVKHIIDELEGMLDMSLFPDNKYTSEMFTIHSGTYRVSFPANKERAESVLKKLKKGYRKRRRVIKREKFICHRGPFDNGALLLSPELNRTLTFSTGGCAPGFYESNAGATGVAYWRQV